MQALVGEHGAALDDLELDAPLRAVHRHAIALPGRVGVEGVTEGRAGGVVDHEREVVLDGDPLAEHVAVAQVSVVLLGIEVQGLEVRVGPQVEFEGAGVVVASARSPRAESACVGVLRAVEAQPA